jgi:hypothetical protein
MVLPERERRQSRTRAKQLAILPDRAPWRGASVPSSTIYLSPIPIWGCEGLESFAVAHHGVVRRPGVAAPTASPTTQEFITY